MFQSEVRSKFQWPGRAEDDDEDLKTKAERIELTLLREQEHRHASDIALLPHSTERNLLLQSVLTVLGSESLHASGLSYGT